MGEDLSPSLHTRWLMEKLHYYKDLDLGPEDNVQRLFADLELSDLCALAVSLEEQHKRDTEHVICLSCLYYSIFQKDGLMEYLEKAFERAEEAALAPPSIHTSIPNHSVKNLIIILLKKHECTDSLEDLIKAISGATKVSAETIEHDPCRSVKAHDLAMMVLRQHSYTLSPEEF